MSGPAPSAWLLAKVAAFTLLVPGTVVALVPYLLLDGASYRAIDWLGLSALGALPVALGAALYLRCAFDFAVTGRGTPAPIDPPRALVAAGPYRYCRNPMYVGVLAILAGEAVLFRAPVLWVYVVVMAAFFQAFIVGYEERALARSFGSSYERYRGTVPRWVPTASALAELHRGSFLKVGALVLGAGALAHVLRLTFGLPVAEMPASIHAILVLLPGYAGLGGIVHARRVLLPGLADKALFAVATGLLVTTAVMHLWSIMVEDSRWLGMFPTWYSVGALFVYGGLAHYLRTRRLIA